MANLNIAVQVVANVGSAAKNLGGLRLSLTDLKSGLDIAQQAFSAAQQVIDATVGPTVALATQQRDLARVTGMTAEEAGVMIQATDDMGVSYGSLQAAAEKLNKEGLSLNAENLRSLRAEYLEITDPVERAEFATDKFGKAAGPKMQKALELSDAAFESFIASAEDSALVLGDDAVAAAREYEIAQDNMADAVQSFNVIVGQELMPLLTDVTNITSTHLVPAISTAVDYWDRAQTSLQMLTVIMADQEIGLQRMAAEQAVSNEQLAQAASITQMYGVDVEHLTEGVTEGEAATRLQALAWQDATLTEEQLAQAAIDSSSALDAHERAAQNAALATDALTAAGQGALTATDLLTLSSNKYSEALLFQQLSANMTDEAALALGLQMGVLDAKTVIAAEQAQKLTEKFDANKDGAIDADEATEEYVKAVQRLHDGIEALPENTTTNVTTNFITTGTPPPILDAEGQTWTGGGMAEGGISTGPNSGYFQLLHGTEAVIPLKHGSVPVEMSGGGAGININIDARGASDPRAVEDAGYRGAQRALREAGMNANIRIRTGGRR